MATTTNNPMKTMPVGDTGRTTWTATEFPSQPNIQNNSVNQVNMRLRGATQNGKLLGGNVSYPRGTRINANGIISLLKGERTPPAI